MKNNVYEYLVTKDWFGSLEKGTRLYYDFKKGGYLYHSEYENISKSDRYTSQEISTTEYFISILLAKKHIDNGDLITGPEIGELEFAENE